MFITSFIPLWITVLFINILSIINNSNNLYTEIIGIIAIFLMNIFSISVIFISLGSIQQSEYKAYKIIDAKQEKGITSEFLLSYVLPLFAFDFTRWDGVVQFLIYFIVLAFLCHRNNNVYANLIFELKKYKFYDCELLWVPEPNSKPIQAMVISKNNLCSQKGNTIEIAPLNKPFYLMKYLEE
ncbi:hypothetical protein [Clostridium thermarum]|nr:hypothetical protein [Clostridium thermarum]